MCDQCLFRCPSTIQRGSRDSGILGDLIYARALNAVFDEDLERGLQDGLIRRLAAGPSATLRRRSPVIRRELFSNTGHLFVPSLEGTSEEARMSADTAVRN